MGQIVAAMATMHAPQLFTRPPEEDPKQLDAGIAAMRQLGKLLDETKPDALIVFGSDHMETFFLKSVPTFAVLSCENATAAFAGRTYNPPIHQALAEAVLEQLVARDFDMAYSQEADLGHSFAAIFEWVLENRAIPVVPIFINTYLPPLPSARRCAALGKAIAEIVASRPERVAVLASGGMSHYPGTWKYYKPAYDFDRWCLQELENSHSDSFLNLSAEQLDEVGNTEMLPWAAVLGAVGPQHTELLSYQPTTHHGHAVAVFHPGDHGSTFGGTPLAAAVGSAALELLVRERLCERARVRGDELLAKLRAIEHPAIREVRGKGLLIGVEIAGSFEVQPEPFGRTALVVVKEEHIRAHRQRQGHLPEHLKARLGAT